MANEPKNAKLLAVIVLVSLGLLMSASAGMYLWFGDVEGAQHGGGAGDDEGGGLSPDGLRGSMWHLNRDGMLGLPI